MPASICLPSSHTSTSYPVPPSKQTNTHCSALFVFFGALAGVGYVDPDAASTIPENEFTLGGPVFDTSEGQLRELQIQEQREREQHWLKKQRPNAVSLGRTRDLHRTSQHVLILLSFSSLTHQGAWMRKHREDGAVRLRPGQKAEHWAGDDAQIHEVGGEVVPPAPN